MIPYIKQHDYIKLERDDSSGIRLYATPDGLKLPSVTTIISATKDMSGIDAWRKWVGESAAAEILKDAGNLGNIMHPYLDNYLMGITVHQKNNYIHILARRMAQNIIDNGLSLLDGFYGTEISLYRKGLYAGTADLVASYDKEMVICDYKNSRKIKKDAHLEDYKIQLVAYSTAHDEMYGTNIKKGIIMMSARPDETTKFIDYKNIILEGLQFQLYKDKWLHRIDDYYKLVS